MEMITQWFRTPVGVAIVCGSVSGGLELIDFDHEAESILPEYLQRIGFHDSDRWTKSLSIVKTPGGYHIRYRTHDPIQGNQKLAMSSSRKETLIETRGEGGYALAPGCPPECHPTGGIYLPWKGQRISKLSYLAPGDRDFLVSAAKQFDAIRTDSYSQDLRPGDWFNASPVTWSDILEPHGWAVVETEGAVTRWRRPGKTTDGWSATTGAAIGKDGTDLLAVFSSNAHPFEGATGGSPCSCYSKFRAYGLLNHGGDQSAAAAAIRRTMTDRRAANPHDPGMAASGPTRADSGGERGGDLRAKAAARYARTLAPHVLEAFRSEANAAAFAELAWAAVEERVAKFLERTLMILGGNDAK